MNCLLLALMFITQLRHTFMIYILYIMEQSSKSLLVVRVGITTYLKGKTYWVVMVPVELPHIAGHFIT